VIKNSYHILSLGCAKNTVDSESMALILAQAGLRRLEEPDQAQFVIVNTCGFIRPAQDESLHLLQQLAAGKRKNQYLIAAGCLSERLKDSLLSETRGVDGVFGTRRWMDILQVIQKIRALSAGEGPYVHFPAQFIDEDQAGDVPRVAVQGASAYLKIADGCRHRCAFCAIPLIKGPQQSRPVEKVVEDARLLQEQGVREINLIAQDSTGYGLDLGLSEGLSVLLEKLLPAVPDVPWIRILYAFPGSLSPRLIDLMAENPQILPYIDIPLQHADPDILRAMHRPANMDWVHSTLQTLRSRIPGIALRSTFIVGYPGETDEKFKVLLDFLREVQLDHVGAFTYSFE
ncbi:MAG: MiaB/RimO family radical SAM methylthiotransferase, partial [Anaerolineaceae bacterium]